MVEVPAEQVERGNRTSWPESICQAAKVPGFRPGKVPLNVIRQRFRTDLRSDATQEIIQRAWKEALEEHDLHPLDGAVVEDLSRRTG